MRGPGFYSTFHMHLHRAFAVSKNKPNSILIFRKASGHVWRYVRLWLQLHMRLKAELSGVGHKYIALRLDTLALAWL